MSHRISPTDASENQPALSVASLSRLKPKSVLTPLLRVAILRIAERHGAERVAPAFAERDAQIEPVAGAVLAADGIGAAETIFEIVTELVRDHVLVEFVGVAGAAEVAEDINAVGNGLRRIIRRRSPVGSRNKSTCRCRRRPDRTDRRSAGCRCSSTNSNPGTRAGRAPRMSCLVRYTVSRIANGAAARSPCSCSRRTRRRMQVARAVAVPLLAAALSTYNVVVRVGVVPDREIPGRRAARSSTSARARE